ncbi:MAG: hypothetical protein LBL58_18400 [Tannerellaceae bacterium]|jgi:hypothetical protein|nr:hypothetical protein [Tannerellaceae bacterium]
MVVKDNFNRLLILLILVLFICIGLYGLPDSLFGYKIKKVDLLSDIRIKETPVLLDSLRAQLEETEIIVIDSVAIRDSVEQADLIDLRDIELRDSLYKVMAANHDADTAGIRIEDYSVGHIGLSRFFSALNQSKSRPVRIAVIGDSFIEGDIMVADFRNDMQKKFGGRGVGFVPVTSSAAQYRPTIDQKVTGWTTHSILNDKKQAYTLSGMTFEVKSDKAEISFKATGYYDRLKCVSSLKLIYKKTEGTNMQLVYNGSSDTINHSLSSANVIGQYIVRADTIKEGRLTFTDAKGFQALGLALEDNEGVVVDNFSLRGNSGLLMEHLDSVDCESFDKIRHYDLIILQYGLNVINEDMLQYGWYKTRMGQVINHLKSCFPETDFLLLGVSDRCNQYNGEFQTMPAILALLHTQRQIARQAGIPFWNTFGAMGGENSMVGFVNKGWASKDYTHLSFRGGREIAKSLINALLLEKEFYDKAERTVQ